MTDYSNRTLRGAYLAGRDRLRAAGIENPAGDARRLAEFVCGGAEVRVSDEIMGEERARRYAELLERRAAGEPLQYLLGTWAFCGLDLEVGPGVLVPRPETEEAVEIAAKTLEGVPKPRILDLCTGSGCIAAALARRFPNAEILAADRYPEPLRIARENFRRLGIENARALRADALRTPPADWTNRFDLLICNPPYLTKAAMAELSPEVRHEPRQALFGGTDGLRFYRALAKKQYRVLKPRGALVAEIGYDQGSTVPELLRERFEDIRVWNDYAGHPRVVTARRRPEADGI